MVGDTIRSSMPIQTQHSQDPRPVLGPASWRRRRSATTLAGACLLAIGLAGCPANGDGAAPPSPPTARAAAPAIAARSGATVATVRRVRDGDTLVVTFRDGRQGDVRLHGIDAPEASQAGGREAGDNLRELALGKDVELDLRGVDPYGRHLAVVSGPDGDLGLLQIRQGHAWHNVRYSDEQEPARRAGYAAAERAARAGRLGLWTATAPESPWDFKQARRTGGETAPQRAADRAGTVIGNRRSRLYHLPGCPGHAAVSPGNAEPFATEQEARDAGYRRASNCPPVP
jgi:endonuclease YncB( thermonuclease family)